jgi:hypothetical protein
MTKQEKLKKYGFVYDVCAGFQFDLNTVLKPLADGFTEGHLCDHNCTLDYGNYDCPAAFTRNKNISPTGTISLENITVSLDRAKNGLVEMNHLFLKKYFDDYSANYGIPADIALEIKSVLQQDGLELNIFGGNPELHPHFLDIIPLAQKTGWKVTTTTTGKKFLYDSVFFQRFAACPPNLLACSADDYESVDELKRLLDMTLDDIKMFWQKANPLYGQRKKAYESIYLAKLTQNKKFCPTLFNVVVHPGNLPMIKEILYLLKAYFPETKINPYPAQASFEYSDINWQDSELSLLNNFIDYMIDNQISQAGKQISDYVPRLPYWLALKSAFITITDKKELNSFISGNNIWQCFRKPGSGRYLQASCAEIKIKSPLNPGCHPGCFWNDRTVTTAERQFWQLNPQDIAWYILADKPVMGQSAVHPCPGCIMPRLMFDGPTVELGLNPRLLPAYFKLRRNYFNF